MFYVINHYKWSLKPSVRLTMRLTPLALNKYVVPHLKRIHSTSLGSVSVSLKSIMVGGIFVLQPEST